MTKKNPLKKLNLQKRNVIETQIIELTKEIKDYEIVQKNNLEQLDNLKNEISDLGYNINAAYRKVTQLGSEQACRRRSRARQNNRHGDECRN